MRCNRESGYWFEVIFGTLLNIFLIYFILNIILFNLPDYFHTNYIYIIFLFSIPFLIYSQWNDDNFKRLDTSFSSNENKKTALKTIRELKWKAYKRTDGLKIIIPRHIQETVEITIIIQEKRIYYNFKYATFNNGLRLTFFFFICSIYRWKFEKRLQIELQNYMKTISFSQKNKIKN